MKYVDVFVTIECTQEDGRSAIGKIVSIMKNLPNDVHVLLKTNSTYVYNIISDGRPWRWKELGWVTEVRKSVIHQRSDWIAFVENHARFKSFELEYL